MKRYQHAKDKKPTERVSFYIALSVCLMAVGFAAWSAYSTFTETPQPTDVTYFSSLSTENAAVAQEMTGVTEPETQAPTEAATQQPEQQATEAERNIIISEKDPDATQDVMSDDASTPLKAVLKIDESLIYPVKSQQVTKPYSEDGVYSDTLHDYRAHTGCDFVAEEGENIYAMCGGIVKDISVSELYGVILEVDCGDFTVYYCGLDTDFLVEKDQEVSTGDTIGTVGHIPCESEDGAHVHIEIRVGDRLIDPLSVIGSDD